MRRSLPFLIGLLLLAAALPAADVEFPLVQAFAWFPYDDNQPLPVRQTRVGLRLAYSNIFSYSPSGYFFNDLELASLTVSARYGLGPRLTAELHLNLRRSGGGFLDRAIEGFHSAFHYPDAGRPRYPRNAVRYQLDGLFDQRSGRSAGLPPILALLAELGRGPHLWLRGRLALGLPLGAVTGYNSGKPFAQAGLLAGWESGAFRAELDNHLARVGRPAWLKDMASRSWVWQGEARLGWRGWRAGLVWRTSPLAWREMGNPAYLVYVGGRVSRRLEIGLTEDLPPFDTSPDIGFYLKLDLGG